MKSEMSANLQVLTSEEFKWCTETVTAEWLFEFAAEVCGTTRAGYQMFCEAAKKANLIKSCEQSEPWALATYLKNIKSMKDKNKSSLQELRDFYEKIPVSEQQAMLKVMYKKAPAKKKVTKLPQYCASVEPKALRTAATNRGIKVSGGNSSEMCAQLIEMYNANLGKSPSEQAVREAIATILNKGEAADAVTKVFGAKYGRSAKGEIENIPTEWYDWPLYPMSGSKKDNYSMYLKWANGEGLKDKDDKFPMPDFATLIK